MRRTRTWRSLRSLTSSTVAIQGVPLRGLHDDAAADELVGQLGGVALVDRGPGAFVVLRFPARDRVVPRGGRSRACGAGLVERWQVEEGTVIGAGHEGIEGGIEPGPELG